MLVLADEDPIHEMRIYNNMVLGYNKDSDPV